MPYKGSRKSEEGDEEALAWMEEVGLIRLGVKLHHVNVAAG